MTFIPPLLSDAVASGTKTLEKTFTFTIDALRRLWLTGLGDSAKKAGNFTCSVLILGGNLKNSFIHGTMCYSQLNRFHLYAQV